MISIISRETGEQRFWVCGHAKTRTCALLSAENVPAGSPQLYTDEWQSYRGDHPAHTTVHHGGHEWAREADRDGRRDVHGHTCQGAGAALRAYLCALRGAHKPYLHLDVAT
jgi:hypothetical protein